MIRKRFIRAAGPFCSFAHHVNAPYLRRSFFLDFEPEDSPLEICGLRFYRLFTNGKEMT